MSLRSVLCALVACLGVACGDSAHRTSGSDQPLAWRTGTEGVDALVADDEVVVAATPFALLAFRSTDGRRLWEFEAQEEGGVALSLQGESVVYDNRHTAWTLDRDNGRVTGERPSAPTPESSLPPSHGILGDSGLAYDIEDGHLVVCRTRTRAAAWSLARRGIVAVQHSRDAVFAQGQVSFFALDVSTGAVRWTVTSTGSDFDPSGDFPVAGSRVFVGLADGTLWGVRIDQPDAAVRQAIGQVSTRAARPPPDAPEPTPDPQFKPTAGMPPGVPAPSASQLMSTERSDDSDQVIVRWQVRGEPSQVAEAYFAALVANGFDVARTENPPDGNTEFRSTADVTSADRTGHVTVARRHAACADPPVTVGILLMPR
jgi:hypothetical protein